MKNILRSKFLLSVFVLIIFHVDCIAQNDTVYVSEFGVHPYTYENCVAQIQSAINACKSKGTHVLVFPKGRYDIWPENAIRKEYFISNTSTERECPSKIKTIGLLFENIHHLRVEGSGAQLMFHGKMTTIAVENCQDISFHNLYIDFERPAGSELEYTNVSEGCVEVKVHKDTKYEIVDGKMNLYGEGWKCNINQCIEYDHEYETFSYTEGWNVLSGSPAHETSPGVIKFFTPKDFLPKKGNRLTIRDIIRDQVGMFIYHSKNIELNEIQMHYMHGLGIISQYSENITIRKSKCAPHPESGRILAASADMTHFSGCKGKVTIDSCYFSGAHDDLINVHGTNLCAVEKIDDHTLNLRFMHGQTYGFQAYHEGDMVAFIKASTMERLAKASVISVKKVSERIWQVCFDQKVPAWLEINHDCVENLTCTPEVEITNNFFTRTSTRGTLVSTPRRVVIRKNTYYKTGMSAILIEGDAEGWFESGPVSDVLIEGNIFVDCAYNGGPHNAVIAINPSNTEVRDTHPVHKNIRIRNNVFKIFDYPVLYAKSTANLFFSDNSIERTTLLSPFTENRHLFRLNGCRNVVIDNIKYKGDVLGKDVFLEHMRRKFLKTSPELKIQIK